MLSLQSNIIWKPCLKLQENNIIINWKFKQHFFSIYLLLFVLYNTIYANSSSSEIEPIEIILNENISISNAEFSGLDWCGDDLILLPQYPYRFDSEYNGCLFSISKSTLTEYLKSKDNSPIFHRKIELDSKGIEKQIKGFQGYEAIVFNGSDVYLAIEAENSVIMSAYIIKGHINQINKKIILNPSSLKEIPLPVNLVNMAIETLLIEDDKVFAIYEANGKNVNKNPKVVSFDLDLQNYDLLEFPNTEYRITDASRNIYNNFWVINYLYEGEKKLLNPAIDYYSVGSSNPTNIQSVERLVQYKFEEGAINLEDNLPIQIKQQEDGKSRNWEGLVKFDSLGFLMITDKFPKTILAYLPYSLGNDDLFMFEETGKFGYKNALEIEIVKPVFHFAQEFSKYGIAAVVDDSGWVYITKQGRKTIRPHVVDNGPDYFSYGLARIKSNNKFGYFDEKGNVKIKPNFDYARPFADSMAAVCLGCQFVRNGEHDEVIGGKWGFINIKGDLLIPFKYDNVSDFKDGKAKVEKNGNFTYINRKN